jgi:hypothetical protein
MHTSARWVYVSPYCLHAFALAEDVRPPRLNCMYVVGSDTNSLSEATGT